MKVNYFLLIVFLTTSCTFHTNEDILESASLLKENYSNNLLKIVEATDSLIEQKPCTLTYVTTSNTTDLVYVEGVINFHTDKDIIPNNFDFDQNYKELLWNCLPQQEITKFNILPKLAYFFYLEKLRSYHVRHPYLVYVLDKDKFKKAYKYEYVDFESVDSFDKWIYPIDSNWVLLHASSYFDKDYKCN